MRHRGNGLVGNRGPPGAKSAGPKITSPKGKEALSPPFVPASARPYKQQTGDLTQRLCRNVLIHGSCRFEDKGCIYSHSPSRNGGIDTIVVSAEAQMQTTSDAPGATSTFSTEHLAAPAFVPRAVSTAPENSDVGDAPAQSNDYGSNGLDELAQDPLLIPQGSSYKLDHHLYTTPLPHTSNLPNSHLPLHSFFIPEDIRTAVVDRAQAKLATDPRDTQLPAEVHVYHSLHVLSSATTTVERSARVFGFLTEVYRATCRLDGRLYCLRRIQGFKLAKEGAFAALDKWRRIRHPNIVSIREAFTTRLFSDSSVVFAYDYHPCARTLFEVHLSGGMGKEPPQPIAERLLWSYIAQIANGLKAVHTAGLAARIIEPTKIILTGKNRLRLNCCSIFDVLAFEHPANMAFQQQDDLINFGKLLLALCFGSTAAVHNPAASMDVVSQNYSPDIKLVIMYLLGKPGPGKCIDDILVMLGPRLLNEFDAMQNYSDTLESAMEAEVENGRIARLMMKLGFINERPEFQMDTRWSETGDRYILKLFRDYVFHSVDEMGQPVLDMSHVLVALNKVDAGIDEKIMLVSRDEQSCIVVSFQDIKRCIDAAYNELAQTPMPHVGSLSMAS